jgi:hypothetical protein
VIVNFVSKFDMCRRVGWLVLLSLASGAYGCGSGNPTSTEARQDGVSAEKRLKSDELYRYEGSGSQKRKIEVSGKALFKQLREASKKAQPK